MLFKFILYAVIIYFITACSTQPTLDSSHSLIDKNPSWLNNPYCDNDKYAAVGCSSQHINGEAAQKKLAISRAIDEIAAQVNVRVKSITLREERNNNINHSSSSISKSKQEVDDVAISTKIKEIYKKENGDLCVWIVSE